MSARLSIDFAPAEGAVPRMVGLVERRGYVIHGLTMSRDDQNAVLLLEVEPRDSGRQVQVVARQLERLIDVKSVFIVSATQESPQ